MEIRGPETFQLFNNRYLLRKHFYAWTGRDQTIPFRLMAETFQMEKLSSRFGESTCLDWILLSDTSRVTTEAKPRIHPLQSVFFRPKTLNSFRFQGREY